MRSRWLCCSLMVLLTAPAAVRAADEPKSTPPTVVLRIRSVDTVIDNVKQIVALAGRENVAQQIKGLIKTKIGPNGIEGIDPKRPFGGYARIGADFHDVNGVVMLPIADEKAFLGWLEKLDLMVTKDKTGLYTMKTFTPVDLSFRFAHKYAYVSALNLEALDPANLIAPAKIFSTSQKAALSATLRLDQIPDAVKEIAISVLEQKLAEVRDKEQPGETGKQREFRMQALKQVLEDINSVLEDGAEFHADADINRATKELTLDVGLTGKPKSRLARRIDELGKSTSLFTHLAEPDSAAHALVHIIPPAMIRKAFAAVVEEGKNKVQDAIQDEGKRKQAEMLVKALSPTLEAADIDAAFAFNQPEKSKHYNLVVAVKLAEGKALAGRLRELATELLKQVPEEERAKIKLDADFVADIKIHRLDIQGKYDAGARAVFGDNPAYLAFRDDALFLAVGADALGTLKKALTAAPAVAPPFELAVSVARLARLLTKAGGPEVNFPAADPGNVRLAIEGGSALRLRLATQLSVLQFFSNIRNARGALGD